MCSQSLQRYQIGSDQINAYTIPKDFQKAIDPTEAFDYNELPALSF